MPESKARITDFRIPATPQELAQAILKAPPPPEEDRETASPE